MECDQKMEKKISALSSVSYSQAGTMLLIFSGVFTSGLNQVMPPYGYFFRFVSYVILTFLCSQYLAKKSGFSLAECRVTKIRLTVRGVLVSIALPGIILLWIIHGEAGHFVYNPLPKETAMEIIFYLLFYTGFCSGIVEEMMFRGVLTRICEESFGRKIAFLIPTFMFALPHLRNYNSVASTLCGILFLTAISSLFTVLMYQSGSIWDSVLVHAVWDMFVARNQVYVVSSSVHENAFFIYLLDNKDYHPLMHVSNEQNQLIISVFLFLAVGILLVIGKMRDRVSAGQ